MRESNFSLEYREIRPLAVFGPRRKDVLRVDSGFVSFRQTPRGRGFSLLGFYSLF